MKAMASSGETGEGWECCQGTPMAKRMALRAWLYDIGLWYAESAELDPPRFERVGSMKSGLRGCK